MNTQYGHACFHSGVNFLAVYRAVSMINSLDSTFTCQLQVIRLL